MLYIIVADNKPFRSKCLSEVISQFSESEVITVDDTLMNLLDLEQFLYPSLFSFGVPIVHGRFLLDNNEIDTILAKKLSASPTIFIFEEIVLPKDTANVLKKAGAILHEGQSTKIKKPKEDIFAATLCITAKDKKSRWLAYRSALEKQPIEAILGILYWKVRTLAIKEPTIGKYGNLYRELLEAQARAWRTGAPLETLIEKVILSQ